MAMRAYTVHIRNFEESWRTGAVDITLLILADDITDALMIGCDRRADLANALEQAGIPNTETIRIKSIAEEYSNVTGHVGINYEKDSIKDQQQWVEEMVKKVKARNHGD